MPWILISIIVVPLIFFIQTYNLFIRLSNQVENVAASTDAILKKRHDLIPQLVTVVKHAMKHEQSVLESLTRLRTEAQRPDIGTGQRLQADQQMNALLGQLYVSVESHPDLKTNENVLHLQMMLSELEEQISAARRAYNAAVEDYQTAIHSFPYNIIASLAGFKEKEFFNWNE